VPLISRYIAFFLLLTAFTFAHGQAGDWATPAEKSDYKTTPTYEETMAYIERVAAAAAGQVKAGP